MSEHIERPVKSAGESDTHEGVMHQPGHQSLPALDVRPFFHEVRASLLGLLVQLTPHEWDAPTAAGSWRVRDVVAHLLGDDVGRLSRSRDAYPGPGPEAGEPLPTFLNRFNEEWVGATTRASPTVLQELLTATSHSIHTFWGQKDLTRLGEAVSWAGPGPAPVWLDCARDFTEDWVHQEQIREAVGRTRPHDPTVLRAVIDTFMYAMPLTLNTHAGHARDGDTLEVRFADDGARIWSWCRERRQWQSTHSADDPTATIVSDSATWWRLCVRMLDPQEARSRMHVIGDARLAAAATEIISIIR